jgi:hypothetical protein
MRGMGPLTFATLALLVTAAISGVPVIVIGGLSFAGTRAAAGSALAEKAVPADGAATIVVGGAARSATEDEPGCEGKSAKECVALALDAMGGQVRLEQVKTLRLQIIGHTELAEQSYRQEPFVVSYERATTTLDFEHQRALIESKVTWPEADSGQAENDSTTVVGPEGGVTRAKESDGPTSLGMLDDARELLALGPMRVLLTAADATDLHFDGIANLRSTSHAVVAFTWGKVPVRMLLNEKNHLPDAVETTQQFRDFWYFWGDVRQRIYFDNFHVFHGIVFPTNLVVERNGLEWKSTQAIGVEFNVATDEKTFAMDAKMARLSAGSVGWHRGFKAGQAQPLAEGVDLYLGAWNSTVVKQDDGIVILEAPISGAYTQGVVEGAKKKYPGAAIKAVLSTSDSWPHTGGVRYAVSAGLLVYILDLNRPLLDKMVAAPHTIEPDALAAAPREPQWKIVAGRVELGSGPNRIELYPLRGASTERQYMVYFPEHQLLYASDTLALSDDGSLYDPELMREVAEAVKRENLNVQTVFAMHQGPVEWAKVMTMIEKAEAPAKN